MSRESNGLVEAIDFVFGGSPFGLTIERPPVRVVSDKPWVEYEDGPRTYVIIQGRNEQVQPYLDAIMAVARQASRE